MWTIKANASGQAEILDSDGKDVSRDFSKVVVTIEAGHLTTMEFTGPVASITGEVEDSQVTKVENENKTD